MGFQHCSKYAGTLGAPPFPVQSHTKAGIKAQRISAGASQTMNPATLQLHLRIAELARGFTRRSPSSDEARLLSITRMPCPDQLGKEDDQSLLKQQEQPQRQQQQRQEQEQEQQTCNDALCTGAISSVMACAASPGLPQPHAFMLHFFAD